ncbi:MAG: hypothetical protein A2826_01295 [Candidatus Doudnabacteria bacterium RIFCSPHIGHO2_01_FULL_43_23]|uniref:Endolytic murein transglycosylase n=1 Tax=Candidatus Doudnabacteria bacterium RIFCSPHIGHO2_01_FULL_43_23 TaxID=1817822 RepID=A0A1F5NTZ5_9BACT|nr:MAG: hypothetical protein A2826_01295 [Candidatus Doudnabacteria bacterium RIFCSPHIGHO2_01_FULL_43_23]
MKDFSVPIKPKNHIILRLILLGLLLLVLVLGAIVLYVNVKAKNSFTDFSNEQIFDISQGEGVSQAASRLEEEGIISSAFIFKVYVRLKGLGQNIQAGSFSLNSNLSIAEIVDRLSTGRGLADEIVVTLTEGSTVLDIASTLESAGLVIATEFIKATKSGNFEEFNFLSDRPQGADLEGYLFPDTYNFKKTSSGMDILEKLLNNFDRKFNADLQEEVSRQGKTIFEIVTMASIVEGEVGRNKDNLTKDDLEKIEEERRLVAGVFYNRLSVNHPLQSDATLGYATGHKKLQLSFEDTQSQNPYNTYQHLGLPPGPINNPSLDSILAAIYPADTDYFYFLSKPDGEAVFGVTLEDHNANKARYLQ